MSILNNRKKYDIRSIKTKLKDIIKSDKYEEVMIKLNKAGNNVNLIVTLSYQFMRAYLLYCYENNKIFPKIDENFIKMTFAVFKDKEGDKRGRQIQGNNLTLVTDLREFYDKYKNNFGDKINAIGLAAILDYSATEMLTAIINNITMHFTGYINKYVNYQYDQIITMMLNKLSIYKSYCMSMDYDVYNYKDYQLFKGQYSYKWSKQEFSSYLPTNFRDEFIKFTSSILEILKNKTTYFTEKRKLLTKLFDKFTKHLKQAYNNSKQRAKYTIIEDKEITEFPDLIKDFRLYYLPNNREKTLTFDLNKNPQKYIPYMIKICKFLETKNCKIPQFFPLRSTTYMSYFKLDSKSIIEILMDKNTTTNKKDYYDNIKDKKKEIWETYFNLKNPIFKSNGYKFDYMITTDCFSVSILFKTDEQIRKDNAKKDNMSNKKKLIKETEKEFTTEEKLESKQLRETKAKNTTKLNKIEYKEDFKILSRAEKSKLTKDKNKKLKEQKEKEDEEYNKLNKKNKKKIDDEKEVINRSTQAEFPYLEDLTERQREELKYKKKVYIDPGRIRILTMLGKSMITKKNAFMSYSSKQRIRETRRLKYANKIEKYKSTTKVCNINTNATIKTNETFLSDYNTKTCNFNKFLSYVRIKNIISRELFKYYDNPIFRKLKWYSYLDKLRSENFLVNNIKKTYGKDVVLMYGDWSSKSQMRGRISTPMIGIKRRLRQDFDVINVDEFNTSKLNYETDKPCKNLKLEMYRYTKEEKKEIKKNKRHKENERRKLRNRNSNINRCKKRFKQEKQTNNNVITLISPRENILARQFITEKYNILLKQLRDQRKTNSIVNKVDVKNKLLTIPTDKKGRYKLHSVLTYKMEKGRFGCINRDRNAIRNMKKIVLYQLDNDNKRHPSFVRIIT